MKESVNHLKVHAFWAYFLIYTHVTTTSVDGAQANLYTSTQPIRKHKIYCTLAFINSHEDKIML
jgi:hypothetical protein